MMNRALLFLLLILGCIPNAFADHITGGEIFYTYTGVSNGMHQYAVTVRLFMRCNSGRQFNNPTILSVFDRASGVRIKDIDVALSNSETLNLTNTDPCITNPPPVCYEVGSYFLNLSLPSSISGYILTAHVLFRIDGISNLVNNYNRIGATYTGEIPSSEVEGASQNNSARFTGNDLVVVCANNTFSYSFAAADSDGDELRYSFCNAYQTMGISGGFGNDLEPPGPPPYQSVPYGPEFNGSMPLGGDVKIDSRTGLLTGIAPEAGVYVVTVCVEEIRNGIVIATQRKDLQINIAPCSIAAAALPDEYMVCNETTTLSVSNLSTSPLIRSYNWEFLNSDGDLLFSSPNSRASFTFADTGSYIIKLYINRDQLCSDSTMAVARVYPGFVPQFDFSSPCIVRPTQFTDATTTAYGRVTAWNWDFGNNNIADDISTTQNPSYNYPSIGNKTVSLIVENSVGCRDTLAKTVNIFDKPPLSLAFSDTLICPPDALRLHAEGSGNFTWSPGLNINSISVPDPIVSPVASTTYYVELNSDGCTNRDSVSVRVVDQVSLQQMNDEIICLGDTIGLRPVTNGLRFSWTPAESLSDPFIINPIAIPTTTTTYQLTSSISSCEATSEVTVTTVPYPVANAGPDTSICYNTSVQLHASTDGNSFLWSPAAILQNATSLHPVAIPLSTTKYVLYAYDTKGCPKAGTDTVIVTVQPDILASAGRDTSAVINQPLQLQASGGVNYVWSPSFGLTANNIANPVAQFDDSPSEGYYIYKVVVSDAVGCKDSAIVNVKVFSTLPEIYVPTAFTPNSDGRNDYFQIMAAGIQDIRLFRVYNRWGQMVYASPLSHSLGWDGSFNGNPQPSGTYVWMVKATDYTGRPLIRKGTVTLIR